MTDEELKERIQFRRSDAPCCGNCRYYKKEEYEDFDIGECCHHVCKTSLSGDVCRLISSQLEVCNLYCKKSDDNARETKDTVGFVQGPWEVRKDAFITVNAANGDIICGCGAMNYPTEWLIQKSLANARLIKAAPQMYELIRSLAHSPDLQEWWQIHHREMLTLIDEIDGKEIAR